LPAFGAFREVGLKREEKRGARGDAAFLVWLATTLTMGDKAGKKGGVMTMHPSGFEGRGGKIKKGGEKRRGGRMMGRSVSW